MYTNRLQMLLGTVLSKLRRAEGSEKDYEQQIGELAEEIMAYGRMIHDDSPHQRLFVNVTEVARRFREDRKTVVKTLVLLRTQGRADRTARSEDWKLNV